MSGKLKELRERIKSVQKTQQITRAMKLVSASKLRRAQDRIVQMRPYSNKLQEILGNISSGVDINLKYAEERDTQKVLLVVIASDGGLCGAFNSQIIKLASTLLAEKYPAQLKARTVSVLPLGKRSAAAFKRRSDVTVVDTYVNIFQQLSFDKAAAAAQTIMDGFVSGEYDVVEIVYSQFKNAATQLPRVERMLPVPKNAPTATASTTNIDFIFQPDKESLLLELAPKILKTQLYKAILDSNASEHGARLTAMDKATNNAQELIRQYSISYNRARQATITNEILEVVSGANALESA